MEGLIQIAWSEDFAVGHKDLDREHLQLVEAVNAIYRAARSERSAIASLLDALLRLVREHFKHENAILLQINRSPIPSGVDRLAFVQVVADAVLDRHVENHWHGLRELNSIIAGIRMSVESAEAGIGSDLKEWFVGHMTVHDAHLRPIFAVLNQPAR